MTAYALITGAIFRAPVQKTSKAGKPYTSCTIKAGSDDGGSGDFWSVLCFSESAQLELLRLEAGDAVSCRGRPRPQRPREAGDAVSVRGKMKLEIFEARISRSIFADAALGLRPAPRMPRAAKAAKAAPTSQTTTTTTTATFDDDIPFIMEWRG
jgi:hypothetical protein